MYWLANSSRLLAACFTSLSISAVTLHPSNFDHLTWRTRECGCCQCGLQRPESAAPVWSGRTPRHLPAPEGAQRFDGSDGKTCFGLVLHQREATAEKVHLNPPLEFTQRPVGDHAQLKRRFFSLMRQKLSLSAIRLNDTFSLQFRFNENTKHCTAPETQQLQAKQGGGCNHAQEMLLSSR